MQLAGRGPLPAVSLGHFLLHHVLAEGMALNDPSHLLHGPAQQELDGQPVGGAGLLGGQGRPAVGTGAVREAEALRSPVPAVEDALGPQDTGRLRHPLLQGLAGYLGPILLGQALGHPLEDPAQDLLPGLAA